jgi:transcriptional regulator with XRE-family HTH domain
MQPKLSELERHAGLNSPVGKSGLQASFENQIRNVSHVCNPELLVFRRRRKGWTQFELARAAGYTERLISKAESGRPISRQAIVDIAEALSFPDHPLAPEDLICNPLTLARQYIELCLAPAAGMRKRALIYSPRTFNVRLVSVVAYPVVQQAKSPRRLETGRKYREIGHCRPDFVLT